MNVQTSYAQAGKQRNDSPGKNYIDAMISLKMLDRYGLGYICMHPEILFPDPCRPASDIASRMYSRNEYANQQGPDVSYEPETLIDRMAESYKVLDQIFSQYKQHYL